MTGERKILTLKRKSLPENQEKASETPVRWSRNKIVIEAVPNPRKKKNLTEPVIGVLRRNRRNFRYPSFSPATSTSRSIISLLFWKV